MRFVLASHHFPPERLGGVELVTLRTAHWLQRGGHSVQVVAIERATEGAPDRVEAREDVYQGVPVVRLTIDLFAPGVPWEWHYRHPVIEEWFQRHLEKERPDVAHIESCYLLSAGIIHAARAAGCATVVSLHDYWFMCPRLTMLRPDDACCDGAGDPYACSWCLMMEQRRYRYLDAATRGLAGMAITRALHWDVAARALAGSAQPAALAQRQRVLDEALAQADVVVTPSPYVRHLLYERGLPPERVRMVAHGLTLSPEAAMARGDTPARYARRFAYLGQVIAPKGLHLLLSAFARVRRAHPDVTLHIYGGGLGLPYERRQQARAGAREGVYWHGRYAPEDVWGVLREVDAVVVPSLWREIGPLVMFEALAAGRPVIASDLPNMHYTLRHEANGLLFRPGDARDLEHQLRRLATEEGILARLRSGIGPARSEEQEMAEMMTVYRQAVSRRAPSAVADGGPRRTPVVGRGAGRRNGRV